MRKIFLPALAAALFAASSHADIVVKGGDKIAFLGDSITQLGNSNPLGYVNLVPAAFQALGIDAVKVPAGISGHKSDNMRARVKRDVIDKNPKWMLLSCGVNDVWHGARGVELEPYKTNIVAILDQVQAAGITPVVMTASVIKEDLDNALNKKLAAYNDFLRAEAKRRGLLLADVNAAMQAKLQAATDRKGNLLTVDGVHLNAAGNELFAETILRAFGATDEQIEKARKSWRDIPGGRSVAVKFSLNEAAQIEAKAKEAGLSVEAYLRQLALGK